MSPMHRRDRPIPPLRLPRGLLRTEAMREETRQAARKARREAPLVILLFVSVLTMISYLQQFTYVQVMTGGGPIHSTETMVLYVYTKAFSNMQLGYASAMSVVLMAIILVVTLAQFRFLRSRWEY